MSIGHDVWLGLRLLFDWSRNFILKHVFHLTETAAFYNSENIITHQPPPPFSTLWTPYTYFINCVQNTENVCRTIKHTHNVGNRNEICFSNLRKVRRTWWLHIFPSTTSRQIGFIIIVRSHMLHTGTPYTKPHCISIQDTCRTRRQLLLRNLLP